MRKQEVDERLEGCVPESNQAYCKMYDFQKSALVDLFGEKKFCTMPTGTGKTVVMFNWLKYSEPNRVLLVTTASKRDCGDFEREADTWCGMGWKESLDSFEVISWHGLSKWVISHWQDIDTYVFAFDEVHNAGAGVNSAMGRAFLQLTHRADCWTGYTATPGDAWIRFYPFFAATGKIRNRVEFERNYTIQSFGGGHPYISGYRQTSELEDMWREISTAPDASLIFKEMPTEQEEYIEFEKPANYENTLRGFSTPRMKTLDEVMSLCHSLRQQCCTKNKLDWIKDFLDGLNTNVIIFYNYKIEGERLEEEIKKKLPKGAKIWHINGRRHDIPTERTIGKHDVVLIQYASGSSSLNLQFINYWVSFSPNYSYTLNV